MEEKEQVLIRAAARRYIFWKLVLSAVCGYVGYRIVQRLLRGFHFSGSGLLLLIAGLLFFDFALLTLIWLFLLSRRPPLVVTDLRICGRTAFGRRIDLPIDMISAVGMRAIGRRIWVSTASGHTRFRKIRNYEQVFNTISSQLARRQDRIRSCETVDMNAAGESLRAAKRLLDAGLLSADEYETVKKRILPL